MPRRRNKKSKSGAEQAAAGGAASINPQGTASSNNVPPTVSRNWGITPAAAVANHSPAGDTYGRNSINSASPFARSYGQYLYGTHPNSAEDRNWQPAVGRGRGISGYQRISSPGFPARRVSMPLNEPASERSWGSFPGEYEGSGLPVSQPNAPNTWASLLRSTRASAQTRANARAAPSYNSRPTREDNSTATSSFRRSSFGFHSTDNSESTLWGGDRFESFPGLTQTGNSQPPLRRQSAPLGSIQFGSVGLGPNVSSHTVPSQPTRVLPLVIPPPPRPGLASTDATSPSSYAFSDDSTDRLSNLRDLAEEASVLLELYSQSTPGEDEDTNLETVKAAFEAVSKIWNEYRPKEDITPHRGQETKKMQDKEKVDAEVDTSLTVYSACIVCYDSVADTVLTPCHHLVLCSRCCDRMGIKEKGTAWVTDEGVKCPLCRGIVNYRIKIYRG
ncbi:hypothetical protein BDZ91DRAFT_751860 [Kalaharituber pfeilii]|nr:hypothetical protein BDZ91DRAFT_751860 [Kalaharituber pfeilii]